MLLTKKHLMHIEEVVGYNCVAGIVLSPITGDTVIRAIAKHPEYGTSFNVQTVIPYTPAHQYLDLEIEHFAAAAKHRVTKEFVDSLLPTADLDPDYVPPLMQDLGL